MTISTIIDDDSRTPTGCLRVVVVAVTPSVTHIRLASDIKRSINESSRRLDWENHCEDFDERGADCFRRQYRMPQETFEKLADILYCVSSLYATVVSPHAP